MPAESRSARAGVPLRAVVVAALAVLATACGGGSSTTTPTTPVAPTTTETFSGTLAVGGFPFHNFTVAQQGTLTATLTSFSPQTTITVGVGIGQPSGATCSLLSASESAKVGYVVSGTIAPGAYCIQIYDIGNVQGTDDYVITVSHP